MKSLPQNTSPDLHVFTHEFYQTFDKDPFVNRRKVNSFKDSCPSGQYVGSSFWAIRPILEQSSTLWLSNLFTMDHAEKWYLSIMLGIFGRLWSAARLAWNLRRSRSWHQTYPALKKSQGVLSLCHWHKYLQHLLCLDLTPNYLPQWEQRNSPSAECPVTECGAPSKGYKSERIQGGREPALGWLKGLKE